VLRVFYSIQGSVFQSNITTTEVEIYAQLDKYFFNPVEPALMGAKLRKQTKRGMGGVSRDSSIVLFQGPLPKNNQFFPTFFQLFKSFPNFSIFSGFRLQQKIRFRVPLQALLQIS